MTIEPDTVMELTATELDVLALMAQGLDNEGIADKLVVSRRTVEAHVNHMFLKLGLRRAKGTHRRVVAVTAYLRWSDSGAGRLLRAAS